MGDINQFKIFVFLKIHVLHHLMSIFPGKKTLNLWWETVSLPQRNVTK